MFFFASLYGQIALAEKATTSSLLILYFFLGFVVSAQIGGRMLDRIGAKRPVVLGCVLAAVGFGLWAGKATDLHVGAQVVYIVMAGAGMGLMLGPGQHRRDQPGLPVLLRRGHRHHPDRPQLRRQPRLRDPRHAADYPVPGRDHRLADRPGPARPAASAQAAKIAQLQGGSGNIAAIPAFIRADFAAATRDVLYGMAIIMAVAAFVALRGLRRGVQQETDEAARGSAPPCQAKTRAPASIPPGARPGRIVAIEIHGPAGVSLTPSPTRIRATKRQALRDQERRLLDQGSRAVDRARATAAGTFWSRLNAVAFMNSSLQFADRCPVPVPLHDHCFGQEWR